MAQRKVLQDRSVRETPFVRVALGPGYEKDRPAGGPIDSGGDAD
jgi:hypothetical protein